MSLDTILTDPSSAMTVVSLITFLGILGWTFILKRSSDFDTAANLPFADDIDEAAAPNTESRHV
jgi:cytochrome c oxidase cbb3-type subunit 4